MTLLAACSLKNSPGATTVALALAVALSNDGSEPAVLVEADPGGGDIAARVGLPVEPGLLSFAAASRHEALTQNVGAHAQRLPSGPNALLAPLSADQASSSVATAASRLIHAARENGHVVIVDCGRWSSSSPSSPIIASADLTLVVCRPTVEGVEHVRSSRSALELLTEGRLRLVVTDNRPYTAAEVEAASQIRVLGLVPTDGRDRDALFAAASPRSARRTAPARAARTLLEAVLADAGRTTPAAV
jgi:MinD-like ATPase involved in chromosome partitioning or flagellar assembly